MMNNELNMQRNLQRGKFVVNSLAEIVSRRHAIAAGRWSIFFSSQLISRSNS